MASDVRIYRDKVWVSGKMKDKLLYFANDVGVEPDEAFKRLIDRGYQLWLAERSRRDRSQRRPS